MVTEQGGFPLDFLKCEWLILSSIQVVDVWWLAKGDFPYLLEMWIRDPIIHPSRWLGVPRQGIFSLDLIKLLDLWSCHPSKSYTCGDSSSGFSPWFDKTAGSMILSFIQVVDLLWLDKGDFPWTFGNVNGWSYYPSKSLTCGDSPRGISRWLDKTARSMIL